ncbi:MAG: 3-oxoacyl-ACP reductase FabG [Acidobacteriota bacterium]|uniref:SDR family oxidoreductase n=1 Tax=Thermoanaerobaculum aquaticum TaxID=1312852 RepID=A0A7C2S7N1_9BACT
MIATGLAGKVVVVTGGAAGIGKATALAFAAEGCRVAVWDVDPRGEEVAAACQNAGGEGRFFRVDVTQASEVEEATSQVVSLWGGVDVLVNNAGIVRDGQLVKFKEGQLVGTMTDEQWEAVIGVNLRGVFNCTRAVAKVMVPRGRGVILNASSVVGLYGNFGQTNYVASKAGVIGMTRVWARELGRYGIRVNAVAPGFVKTEILASMPQKVLDEMVQHTPLRRMGQPEDIAQAYLWLACDAASFVTGAVLSVDGGLVVGT